MRLLIGAVLLLIFYTAVLLLGFVAGVITGTHIKKEEHKNER